MPNYADLAALIADVNATVTANGVKRVTGPKLNKILIGIIENLGTDPETNEGIVRLLTHLISRNPADAIQGLLLNDDLILLNPTNYNVALKQGGFSALSIREFPGVNGVGQRSDVVGSFFGYNTTSGGGQQIAGEGSVRFAVENHYVIGGEAFFEFHLPEMFTNGGLGIRPLSMYIRKETGIGAIVSQINQYAFKRVDVDHTWLTLIHEGGQHSKIDLTPPVGGYSIIKLNSILATPGAVNESATLIVNGYGGGLEFSCSTGFSFLGNIAVTGQVTTSGSIRTPKIDIIGISTDERLLRVGDNVAQDKFEITPDHIKSRVPFQVHGSMTVQYNPMYLISNIIASTGKIGMGTSDPQAPLHIKNAEGGINGIRLGTTDASYVSEAMIANSYDSLYITQNLYFIPGVGWTAVTESKPTARIEVNCNNPGASVISFYTANTNGTGGDKENVMIGHVSNFGLKVDGTMPNTPTAKVNIYSKDKGVLLPTMTHAELLAIPSPEPSLIVTVEDTPALSGLYINKKQADLSFAWEKIGGDIDGDTEELTVFDRTKTGLVPQAPEGTGITKFLCEDSTFREPEGSGTGFDHSDVINGIRALGSPIVAISLGIPYHFGACYQQDIFMENLYLQAVYLNKAELITHIQTFIWTAGVYTASGENRLCLYKQNLDGATYDLVGQTLDDPTLWQTGGFIARPLTTSYIAERGLYFVGLQVNIGTTPTTRPQLMCVTQSASGLMTLNMTNGKGITSKASVSSPPFSILASTTNPFDLTSPLWAAIISNPM